VARRRGEDGGQPAEAGENGDQSRATGPRMDEKGAWNGKRGQGRIEMVMDGEGRDGEEGRGPG
jgi:hypothetical protein